MCERIELICFHCVSRKQIKESDETERNQKQCVQKISNSSYTLISISLPAFIAFPIELLREVIEVIDPKRKESYNFPELSRRGGKQQNRQ